VVKKEKVPRWQRKKGGTRDSSLVTSSMERKRKHLSMRLLLPVTERKENKKDLQLLILEEERTMPTKGRCCRLEKKGLLDGCLWGAPILLSHGRGEFMSARRFPWPRNSPLPFTEEEGRPTR